MSEIDRKIAALAEKQHGVLTYGQADAAGLGDDAVWHRVRSGRWEVVADGVYRLRGSPPTWEQRLLAVTFAAGPAAAASHRSAAALLGIPGFERRGVAEVTTPRARRYRGPGGIVHRWRPFPDHHLTVIDGIPSTRVARTLVDLAGVLHPGKAERAVDNCLAAGAVTFSALRDTFLELATRGRKGIAVMRAVLAERGPEYVAPASELEARFLDLVHSAGLPEPVRQLDVGDAHGWIGRVDFAYPSMGLLIELDGARYHTSQLDRQADDRRDAALLAAGWQAVDRYGWDDIVDRPSGVVAGLRDRLRAPAA